MASTSLQSMMYSLPSMLCAQLFPLHRSSDVLGHGKTPLPLVVPVCPIFSLTLHLSTQFLLTVLVTAIHFIADDLAEFAKSIGLSFDATPVLGGHRSLVRYLCMHSHIVQSDA